MAVAAKVSTVVQGGRSGPDETREHCCSLYHRAVELIGKRWTGAILFVLLDGPLHFSAIRQLVAVVSDLKGWKDWGPWELSEVVQEGSPDPNGVGAIRLIRADKRALGRKPKLREQVNVFEPPQRFGYTVLSGMPVKDYQATVTL